MIVRLRTGLASGGVLHTDSNGRDMQRRVRDFRPSWSLNTSTAAGFEAEAGNYYPINSVATLGDDEAELALVTDRAQVRFCLPAIRIQGDQGRGGLGYRFTV